MSITLEIVAHNNQPHDTSSVLGQDPYHGAARDNPVWHYQVMKLSIDQQQMVAQESTWLKQLIEDLHQPTDYQVKIFYDNLSSIRLVENLFFSCKNQTHRTPLPLHKGKGP